MGHARTSKQDYENVLCASTINPRYFLPATAIKDLILDLLKMLLEQLRQLLYNYNMYNQFCNSLSITKKKHVLNAFFVMILDLGLSANKFEASGLFNYTNKCV